MARRLTLKWIDVDDEVVSALCAAIPAWTELTEISISRGWKMYVSARVWQEFMECLAQCAQLEILKLDWMKITDDHVGVLCHILTSLRNLTELSMSWSKVTEDGFRQLTASLQKRDEKLEILNAWQNPGYESMKKDLMEICHYLPWHLSFPDCE